MVTRERRWSVVALVDGASVHSWLGRATDPTDQEIEHAASSLRERNIAAWLAVTEGVYYSTEVMTAVMVRPLSGEGDWDTAWTAFLNARRAKMADAG